MNTIEEREHYLKCVITDILGYQAINYLYAKYKSFKKIYESNTDDWEEISETIKKRWNKEKKQKKYQILQERIYTKNIQWVSIFDDAYPQLLKEIASPPVILYYQGNWNAIHTKALGVVGTRKMSIYGEQVINEIIPKIARLGITITSGFQKGIDQTAHKAALDEAGTTIAVLGTGIDVPYPSDSEKLFEMIIQKKGLIISEYPPTTQAFKQNFPRRNRIIAGISHGVLVIEATINSGSLITARYAAEQGKDVYAIPGSIFSALSQGTHYLIAQGAKIITNAEDIITELIPQKHTTITYEPTLTSQTQHAIYTQLKITPMTFDEISMACNIPTDQLSAELTMMEVQGVIKLTMNGQYTKT